jgi:hypothetical protein
MSKKTLDDWRGMFAGGSHHGPLAAPEALGKQLRCKLAEVVAEPLPAEMRDLLSELEASLDRKERT